MPAAPCLAPCFYCSPVAAADDLQMKLKVKVAVPLVCSSRIRQAGRRLEGPPAHMPNTCLTPLATLGRAPLSMQSTHCCL